MTGFPMAKLMEPSAEQLAEWDAWVAERPPSVRAVAERFNPWTVYRFKDTGQRCTILAFGEDGTVRVAVTSVLNFVTFEREVFGVDPDNLEESDLPGPDELTGAMFVEEPDVERCADALRPQILAARVADGTMTQAEMERILAAHRPKQDRSRGDE